MLVDRPVTQLYLCSRSLPVLPQPPGPAPVNHVEDIREMGKPPETPNPKPEREMGKREKKPRNQRGKWEKEENGKRKREGEPNGVTTPLPSSKNRDVLYAMG